MVTKKCELCGSEDKRLFIKAKDRHEQKKEYSYIKCSKCGLVKLKEKVSNKESFKAYNLTEPSAVQRVILKMEYNKIKRIIMKGKILDFGCGSGNLAGYLKDKGFDVDCLEVDPTYIRWLKGKKKLKVIKTIPKKKELYDVIIMNNVLEHLEKPLKTIIELRPLLKPNGVMIVSIPNINSLQARIFKERWFHLDAPRHINHFYGKSFALLVSKAGLGIRKKYFFNLSIDPTGWYWSMTKSKKQISLKEQIILALFIPLVMITSAIGNTGQVTYILEKR